MWRQNLPHSASTCQQKKGNRIKTGLKKKLGYGNAIALPQQVCVLSVWVCSVCQDPPCKTSFLWRYHNTSLHVRMVWKLRPEERAGCDVATPTEDWNMAFFWPEFSIFPQKYFLQEQRAEHYKSRPLSMQILTELSSFIEQPLNSEKGEPYNSCI